MGRMNPTRYHYVPTGTVTAILELKKNLSRSVNTEIFITHICSDLVNITPYTNITTDRLTLLFKNVYCYFNTIY